VIDTGTARWSAGIRQAATNGIAASRVKTAAVRAAVTIRVTLHIRTSIQAPGNRKHFGKALAADEMRDLRRGWS
jgi:hypothetical protein